MRLKIILILILFSGFTSCKAQENVRKERMIRETKNLVSSYFDSVAENNSNKFQNKILHFIDNRHWTDSLIPSQLWLVQNFNITKEADVIDFEVFFDEKDVQHLQSSSKNFKVNYWDEIIDHPSLITDDSLGMTLSSPAFDKSFCHAIFYLSSNEGGSLVIFKKEEGQWIYFAAGMLWFE